MSKNSKNTKSRKGKAEAGHFRVVEPFEPFEDPARSALHRRIVDFLWAEMSRSGSRIAIELVRYDPDTINDAIREWCASDDNAGKIAADIIREMNSSSGSSPHIPYRLIAEDHLGQQREIMIHTPIPGISPGISIDQAHPATRPPGEPFVLKIEGIGVRVDVRVEHGRSLAEIVQAIKDGVSDALHPVMPALIASLTQVGDRETSISHMTTEELEQLMESIRAERDCRLGMRS
jgi:hypothetical protein